MNLMDLITGLSNGGGLPPDAMPINQGSFPSDAPIPMPMPRPPGAPGPDMMSAPAGMPMPDDGSMPPGAPLNLSGAPQGQGGLLQMILGPTGGNDVLQKASRSLAGGLSKVGAQPFAGQAFANSMGGALEGGNSYEDQQFKDKLGVLDRALKNKQIDARIDSADDLADHRAGLRSIGQQRADQTGVYQNGRLALGERGVAVKEGEAPSRIALNNSRIDLNSSRVAGADRTSLMQADAQADRWRSETGKTLRQAKQSIMQDYSLRPDQKQAQLAAVDQKLQDADDQYFKMKADNRAARGLDADGKPMPKQKAATTGATAAKPGEISMGGNGTRQQPYQPATPEDYDQMESGTFYLHPDGSLRQKK